MDQGCAWQWGPLGAAQAAGMTQWACCSLVNGITAIFVKNIIGIVKRRPCVREMMRFLAEQGCETWPPSSLGEAFSWRVGRLG